MKKQHSLAQKTVYSTVLSCIVFGMVALLLALSVYTGALARQYINTADGIVRQTRESVIHGADALPYLAQVMDIYSGLSEAQRQKVGTEEYRSYFADVDTDKGGTYDLLVHMLGGGLQYHAELYDLYIAMYDKETCSIVYIVDADPDPQTRLMPGDWEPVNEAGMLRFLNAGMDEKLYDIDNTELYGLLCTVGAPIQDQSGETAAFVLADMSMHNLLDGMKGFVWKFALAMAVLTLLIAWLQAKRIKYKLVDPINQIAEASQRFAAGEDTGETNHFAQLDIHTGDELEHLAHTMADMEHRIKEYGANLLKITAEKERISTELSLAQKIQASMLPHIFPPYPDRHEFDLYAMMEPAKEVGGDFYDFFLIDEDHLCIVMADVSGKGIPAALFMMIAKTILQSCAMLGKSAAEILTKTNEALCTNNQVEMFVTVWLGILEISTGKLTCANAGHEYPMLKQNGGKYVLYKDKHSFPVGGMEGMRYKEYEIQLHAGDRLFLYTDGVPEAADAQNEMFGYDRMLDALNGADHDTPQAVLQHVREAVSGFVRDAEQFDDLTMLCMEYRGNAGRNPS